MARLSGQVKPAFSTALFLLPLTFCGQNNAFVPGQMLELRGQVLDAESKAPLVISRLTLVADSVVGETVTDFDGNYKFRFCSNKAKGDSVILQVESLGYPMRSILVKAGTDLSLIIYLKADSTFQLTEQTKQHYFDSHLLPTCGFEKYQRDHEANPMFRHCDGRIESFRRLEELNERMEEWERL